MKEPVLTPKQKAAMVSCFRLPQPFWIEGKISLNTARVLEHTHGLWESEPNRKYFYKCTPKGRQVAEELWRAAMNKLAESRQNEVKNGIG